MPRINSCADAASQKGHVDAHTGGPNTLSDVKLTRTVHACEPEGADKPALSTSQATDHLPGWVPGAPLWEQPGILEESSVFPSSANSSSRSFKTMWHTLIKGSGLARLDPRLALAALLMRTFMPALLSFLSLTPLLRVLMQITVLIQAVPLPMCSSLGATLPAALRVTLTRGKG